MIFTTEMNGYTIKFEKEDNLEERLLTKHKIEMLAVELRLFKGDISK